MVRLLTFSLSLILSLHILSLLVVCIIPHRNFISVAWILFNFFFVYVQVSDAYFKTGLKYVLYIAILLLMGTFLLQINYLLLLIINL